MLSPSPKKIALWFLIGAVLLSAPDFDAQIDGAQPEQAWAKMICPKCATEQFKPLGEIVCGNCDCRFEVRILKA